MKILCKFGARERDPVQGFCNRPPNRGDARMSLRGMPRDCAAERFTAATAEQLKILSCLNELQATIFPYVGDNRSCLSYLSPLRCSAHSAVNSEIMTVHRGSRRNRREIACFFVLDKLQPISVSETKADYLALSYFSSPRSPRHSAVNPFPPPREFGTFGCVV